MLCPHPCPHSSISLHHGWPLSLEKIFTQVILVVHNGHDPLIQRQRKDSLFQNLGRMPPIFRLWIYRLAHHPLASLLPHLLRKGLAQSGGFVYLGIQSIHRSEQYFLPSSRADIESHIAVFNFPIGSSSLQQQKLSVMRWWSPHHCKHSSRDWMKYVPWYCRKDAQWNHFEPLLLYNSVISSHVVFLQKQ